MRLPTGSPILVACLLTTALLPVPSSAACPCSVSDTFSVPGDTVVVSLDPLGGPAEALAGSTVTVTGAFGTVRTDAATAVVLSDGFGTGVAAVAYARVEDRSETWVSAGGPGGPTVADLEVSGPPPVIHNLGITWRFQGVEMSDHRWLMVLSVPEAQSLSVDIDLSFDTQVDHERGPENGHGRLAGPSDQEGGLQVVRGDTSVGVARAMTAQGPDGMRAYGLMFGDTQARMTGLYGIDGPDGVDHRVAVVDGKPPVAFVAGGPPGTYAFEQDVVVTREARFPGPVAVFFAAPAAF